jgi:hypothetical protein
MNRPEDAFPAGQAVVAVFGFVPQDEPVLGEAALDGLDSAQHTGMILGQEPTRGISSSRLASGAAGFRYALTMEVRDSPVDRTKAINEELGKRRGWILTLAIGFAVYILSVVIGLQTAGPLCGSPLLPQSLTAEMFDSQHGTGMAAKCYRNIDSASVPVWILMALGIGLVVAGVTVRIVSIRRSDDGTPNLTKAPPLR